MTAEAQFIIDSMPNTEEVVVECMIHQLYAIHTVLHTIDPTLTLDRRETLILTAED
jgi:hypothetical protein